LFGSKHAGHTGVRNAIVEVGNELLRQKVISRDDYKNLNCELCSLVAYIFLRHQYPAVAHILTHTVNLAFGPNQASKMSGF